ncbi:conserved Plasmodium protein, unknown function [Plasmodium reichenowi]|uniref:Uncharacterized protein n=1 Tax=Plasmodium reichenowi TaxID=5854 RepID=A0A2P9D780_PLARE|nr:conserved Plasmodium protein, unknown function [Plasmodium reichenowi]
MIRLIFLFIIDFFIGVIIINVFFFEYVKCQGKFVNTKKEFPKIRNISNTFKQIKFFAPSKKKKRNYMFLSKHNFRKNNDNGISSSNKKKNFLLKYQTRNNVMYRIICNHNLLILNNTSFLKPTKLTIYNHDAPKNDISANDPEKARRKSKALPTNNLNDKKEENVLPIDKANDQNDNVTSPVNNLNEHETNNLSLKKNEETKNKNISENNDTWKKYLEDKRKKEILKDLENKRNKNNNIKKKKNYNNEYMKNIKEYTHNNNNNNNNSNTCEIIQKDELNGNDEIIKDQSNYSNDHNNDYYDDDNDYYEDDGDDDDYDDDDDDNNNDNDFIDEYSDLEKQERQYDNLQNGKFSYFNNINDTNKNFKNHKTYNEEKRNNNNSSSLNDSINNIFSSNKKNDLPLFFSLNNKSFENSNNKYFDKICSISPNELINRFFENTSERVKEAVKNIIFNIIGNIQKYTIETSILITYEKIYNFLLQIILTGYMIKNADYRLTLNESLYDQNNILNKKDYDQQQDEQENVNKEKQQNNEYQEDDLFNLKKSFHALFSDNNRNNMSEEQLNKGEMLNSKHIIDPNETNNTNNNNNNNNIDNYKTNGESNDITNDTTSDDYPIINTKNYILFLRKKINSLEKQLNILKESKTFLNDDLLSYIKSLTEIQLRSLTDNIGPLVLDSTKKIVELVIQGMTLNINKNMSNELIYVSGSVLTYICFWQLIIGYTLREMEIRDELSDYLKGS